MLRSQRPSSTPLKSLSSSLALCFLRAVALENACNNVREETIFSGFINVAPAVDLMTIFLVDRNCEFLILGVKGIKGWSVSLPDYR